MKPHHSIAITLLLFLFLTTPTIQMSDDEYFGQDINTLTKEWLISAASSNSPTGNSLCKICSFAFQGSLNLFVQNKLLVQTISTIGCTIVRKQPKLCYQIINGMADKVMHSVEILSQSNILCRYLIPVCPNLFKYADFNGWRLNLMKSKPQNQIDPLPTGKSNFTIAVVSDTHVDLLYTPGKSINCGLPAGCCSKYTFKAKNESDAAGYWGSLGGKCDVPARTIESAFKYIATQIKPDIIFALGDYTDHIDWTESLERNTDQIKFTFELLKKYFPNTQVYPVLGNHESPQVNVYDVFTGTDNNMLILNGYYFKDWLTPQAYDSFTKNGYYTEFNQKFNFRVLALWCNLYSSQNWYLINNKKDPNGMLQWIEDTLLEAEKNGETVYLLTHIPPTQRMDRFQNRFKVLMDRFEYTVQAIFSGHGHKDYMYFHYDWSSTKPVMVEYNFPGITTFSNLNPSFKYLTIDQDSKIPLKIYSHRLDLNKANLSPLQEPDWPQVYEASEYYGLKDLTRATWFEWTQLVKNQDDTTMSKIYYQYLSGVNPLAVLDKDKKKWIQCKMLTDTGDQAAICAGGAKKSKNFLKRITSLQTMYKDQFTEDVI